MLEEYQTDRSIWEQNIDTVNLRSDILVTNRIIRILGNINEKNILDIGCGNGKLARKLATRGAKVTGLDCIKAQVDFAFQIEKERKQEITYIDSNIMNIDTQLSLGNFDIVIASMLHLYLTKDEFIRSFTIIKTLLKPKGIFVYANIHPSRANSTHKKSTGVSILTLPTMSDQQFSTQFFHHSAQTLKQAIKKSQLKEITTYEPEPTKTELIKYQKLFSDYKHKPHYLIKTMQS